MCTLDDVLCRQCTHENISGKQHRPTGMGSSPRVDLTATGPGEGGVLPYRCNYRVRQLVAQNAH